MLAPRTDLWHTVRPAVPTIISIVRLFSPAYLLMLFISGYALTFLVAIICTALTDWLDGYFADRWNCKSQLGAALDIAADKVFCLTLMAFCLVYWHYSVWIIIPCAVLLSYHVGVITMRVFGSLPFRSSVVAKTRMFVEAASLIGLLVSFGLGTHLALFDGIGLFALWVAAMMSVWSALTYAGRLPDMPLHAFMPKRASR